MFTLDVIEELINKLIVKHCMAMTYKPSTWKVCCNAQIKCYVTFKIKR